MNTKVEDRRSSRGRRSPSSNTSRFAIPADGCCARRSRVWFGPLVEIVFRPQRFLSPPISCKRRSVDPLPRTQHTHRSAPSAQFTSKSRPPDTRHRRVHALFQEPEQPDQLRRHSLLDLRFSPILRTGKQVTRTGPASEVRPQIPGLSEKLGTRTGWRSRDQGCGKRFVGSFPSNGHRTVMDL